MLVKIFIKFLSILSKIINKKVFYTSLESLTFHDQMAVLDPLGFWYTGNLYDPSDIAYGIVNRSSVIGEGAFVTSILEQVLSKSDEKQFIFYDIGANTGYFGILAKNYGGNRLTSHFFEPLPIHTDSIKRSIFLNRFEEESHIHELGLGNENAQKTFYIAGSGSSLLSDFSASNPDNTCTINVKKLSDYQKEAQLELPDFVKIDVEGNEYDVILGGISTFSQSQPVLYVEIAKDLKNLGRDFTNLHFNDIFVCLKDIGYQSFRVSDDYSEVKLFTNEKEVSGVHMYLFLHGEKHSDIISNYAH